MKEDKTYNLTRTQRLFLPLMWIGWALYVPEPNSKGKKTWHEYKKGIEKHTCNFTIPHKEVFAGRGFNFLKCEHEGCYTMKPID